MDKTALLNLPYIMPAQAQKHVTHNEALRLLDVVVQLSILDRDIALPPDDAEDGDRYLVAADASDAWTGHDGAVAAWQDGAWAFYAPRAGWLAWVIDEEILLCCDGTGWNPVTSAATLNPTPFVGVNATADEINRLTVAADATLLTHDGAGHQLKLNKAAPGDTGTLLFQTGWSGRAEMGLAGNDDFAIKVSPDGAAWQTALALSRSTARVGLGVDDPQAVLHVKAAANGQNLFRFDDAAGESLWRASFDGTNFHNYLGKSIYVNLTGTNTFNIQGGNGIRGETIQVLTTAADYATGSKTLRVGDNGPGYATASQQLTMPNMMFRAHAWNGSNGHTLTTAGWFGLEQVSAASGQAKFFWKMGAFANPARMVLDHGGNLSVAGSVSAASFAKVGSVSVAALPSASAAGAGSIIHVADEAGGSTLAFSDGTDWRRVADRAVVS